MAVDDHGDGGVVEFQAGGILSRIFYSIAFVLELRVFLFGIVRDANWHEPSSHVAALQADGKVHVYPGDL